MSGPFDNVTEHKPLTELALAILNAPLITKNDVDELALASLHRGDVLDGSTTEVGNFFDRVRKGDQIAALQLLYALKDEVGYDKVKAWFGFENSILFATMPVSNRIELSGSFEEVSTFFLSFPDMTHDPGPAYSVDFEDSGGRTVKAWIWK